MHYETNTAGVRFEICNFKPIHSQYTYQKPPQSQIPTLTDRCVYTRVHSAPLALQLTSGTWQWSYEGTPFSIYYVEHAGLEAPSSSAPLVFLPAFSDVCTVKVQGAWWDDGDDGCALLG